jgi:glutamine amidotransferase
MRTVHIVDYGIGNLLSVQRAFECIGSRVLFIKSKNDFKDIDYLVLPGVGAFNHCSEEIKKKGLWDPIIDFVEKERPFLGICVGMQLMMEVSYEFGEFPGFGFIKGKVDLLPKDETNIDKIPFIGWKSLNINKKRV